MAKLVGGVPPFPGKNNSLTGANDPDVIFGAYGSRRRRFVGITVCNRLKLRH